MKKIVCVLLTVLLFAAAGCTQPDGGQTQEGPTMTAQPAVTAVITEEVDFLTETWISTELTFHTTKEYKKNAQFETVMDAVFTQRETGTTLTIPAFWDGGDVFKVRFAPTETGVWQFKTVCASDESLDGLSGTVGANPYSGDLAVYRHGFVTVDPAKKYFVYADGTPFFYLGDTHWAMCSEEFDEAGPYAGELKTDSHFKYIVDKRVEQGFTVYQSQPGKTGYTIESGFTEKDIDGFRKLDKYFRYIAEKGLVHANSEFFFTSTMTRVLGRRTAYIESLSRYWVARFSSYPVLWTLAQEMDNDFLAENQANPDWTYKNNPWVQVGEYIHKYDPYQHPLTGHQENVYHTTIRGIASGYDPNYKTSNNGISLFADEAVCEKTGHNWWGAQWHPSLNGKLQEADFNVAKEYWLSRQVAVLYESRYDGMWTKEYGARAQGWIAYLNGFYGYGYGAQDIWAYENDFMKNDSWNDGYELVTPEDHAMRWSEAIELASGYQVGYMRRFFESIAWYKLKPSFNTGLYFQPSKLETVLYACATDGNNTVVVYLYSHGRRSGTVRGLDASAAYAATWFDPRTGERTEIGDMQGAAFEIPLKPDANDWVLLVTKK